MRGRSHHRRRPAVARGHGGAQRRPPRQRRSKLRWRPSCQDAGISSGQLEHIERDAILKALEQTRYNKTAAARLLGMTFRALRYKVKKLGIE